MLFLQRLQRNISKGGKTMLEELKELIKYIEFLQDFDETYYGDLKMLNGELVYVYTENARMNCKALEDREDILSLIAELDYSKANLVSYEGIEDDLDYPYNV